MFPYQNGVSNILLFGNLESVWSTAYYANFHSLAVESGHFYSDLPSFTHEKCIKMLSFHGFLPVLPGNFPLSRPRRGQGAHSRPPSRSGGGHGRRRGPPDLQGLGEVSGNPQRMAPHLLVGNDRENDGKMMGEWWDMASYSHSKTSVKLGMRWYKNDYEWLLMMVYHSQLTI